MPANLIAGGMYEIPLGMVNVWLFEANDGLVLIDTGMAIHAEKILEAIAELGKQPGDVHHIIISHAHPDHIGSLAALKRATGAQTYCHPLDVAIIEAGGDFDPNGKPRLFKPAPGLLTKILFRLLIRPYYGIEAAPIDHKIEDGTKLDFLPDLRVIFTPGHGLGHLSFLWEREGGVLLAVDSCANLPTLNWSLGYEDFEQGRQSLKKLCALDFQKVTFGHGKAILRNGGDRWRKKWGKL